MSETKSETKTTDNRAYYIRLAGVLFIITAITALLLGVVNAVTADRIKELQDNATAEAMRIVMPDAAEFISLGYSDDNVKDVLEAKDSSGNMIGYCVQAGPKGFGGEISMVVGVDANGNVAGVYIISHSETPGLGTKAEAPEFLDQFKGKKANINVNTGETNSIDTISGATVTSKAVADGVNFATDAVAAAKGGTK